jgi:uncharacterized phage protein gp47/JayE
VAEVTEAATIALGNEGRPKRVTAYGRDENAIVRPLAVDEDGKLLAVVEGVTLEAAQIDADFTNLEAAIGAASDAAEADSSQSASLIAAIKGLNANITALLALVGTASDTESDATILGKLTRIAVALES